MASVSFRDIKKSFGKVDILRGLGFDIADGEFVVLVARREGDALNVVAQLDGGLVQAAVRRAAA